MNFRKWVRLPTTWIEECGLVQLKWGKSGSANISGMMLLIVIAQSAEDETGTSRCTYDQLQEATGLSRAIVAKGLKVIEKLGLITKEEIQSTYQLSNYALNHGWAKLPARGLYQSGRIRAFHEFNLRKRVELDALKLYLLFVSRRDRTTNLALISYDKISDYSGISRDQIKPALSLLAAHTLVHIEFLPSAVNEYGVSNAYRVTHIEPYVHMGTLGRTIETASVQVDL